LLGSDIEFSTGIEGMFIFKLAASLLRVAPEKSIFEFVLTHT
jgi:hypothetical protein